MKILHTADLHIGKKFYDISLLEDQRYVLNQIYEKCRDQKIDVILLCGDIYNSSSPTPESMTLFNEFIESLATLEIKIFIIPGNHDSDQRISYFSNLVDTRKIHIAKPFDGTIQKEKVVVNGQEANFFMLPFVKPIMVRKYYPEEKIVTYEDAIRVLIDHTNIDMRENNILLAHQFITGALHSDVEELSIGGLDNVDYHVFDCFDYVALGHIHRAQKVGRDNLRYSGSIMKYSFSETDTKSVTIINYNSKDDIQITKSDLVPLRDLETREGYFDNFFGYIKNQEPTDNFVRVILNDLYLQPDAKQQFYSLFPNMVKFIIKNDRFDDSKNVDVAEENMEDKDIISLFSEFYELQNNSTSLSEEHIETLTDILKEMEDN